MRFLKATLRLAPGASRQAMCLGVAAALSLVLAACGGGAPPQTFDLSAPRDVVAGKGRGILVVSEPSALAALDSNRILITTSASGLAYLPNAQWADRLPRLVQVRLIQTFENGSRIQAVGRPGDRLVPVAQLNSEIRSFGIDERSGEAVVEISVKIVNDRTGRILAGRIFTSRQPAGSSDGAAASAALDLALQRLLREVVRWTSARV